MKRLLAAGSLLLAVAAACAAQLPEMQQPELRRQELQQAQQQLQQAQSQLAQTEAGQSNPQERQLRRQEVQQRQRELRETQQQLQRQQRELQRLQMRANPRPEVARVPSARPAVAALGAQRPGLENTLGIPGGRWWTRPEMAERLGITPDQQKKMDDVFQQNRLKLIDAEASLRKEEAIMEPLVSAEQPDEGRIVSQIDRVAQARAELEKTNARMLLGIRRLLTPDQWSRLKTQPPAPPRPPAPAVMPPQPPRPVQPAASPTAPNPRVM